MISFFRYLSARQRLKFSNRLIEEMGGEDRVDPYLLAQKDMNISETTYYWYRTIAEIIYLLIFVAVCVIINEVLLYGKGEDYLRTLWGGICSQYAQTMAWTELQIQTIRESMSR